MGKKIYGLLGHPVGHSLSPAMHNAAFKALGIDAEYSLFDVERGGLEGFLSGITHRNISGVNVTIPHKIKAKEFIEKHGSLNPVAAKLGAVNTIHVIEGALKGFNTDGPGFYRSLVEDLEFEPEGKIIFVLGAGGASRAIVMFLGNGPKKIFVTDVDRQHLEDIARQYARYYDAKRLDIIMPEHIPDAVAVSELFIQATPVGMKENDPSPIDKKLLHTGLRVYDLVYNRPMTQLVRDARERKMHATTGLGMLLYQGAISFELWTGKKPPIDVMKKALKMALKDH